MDKAATLSMAIFSIKNRQQPLAVNIRGGDKRDRTADLLNAIQALSQLSYTPIQFILYMIPK